MQTNPQSITSLEKNPLSFARYFEPEAIIRDNSVIKCGFNVMPDRPVEESFKVKEYRVWPKYAEATFDREYFSSMKKSPDHLIFLTGLVHTQKLIYIYLCNEWGIPYGPNEVEKFKIWPTKVEIDMPTMVRKKNDVVQTLHVNSLTEDKNGVFEINIKSSFNNVVTINAVCRVFKI
jgi:hypothetical protein